MLSVCPWCGGDIEYFTDDDNSNYNEYICEYYNKTNPFTKVKCWWRESSGEPAIERAEFQKKRAKIEAAIQKAQSMIRQGEEILDNVERGKVV